MLGRHVSEKISTFGRCRLNSSMAASDKFVWEMLRYTRREHRVRSVTSMRRTSSVSVALPLRPRNVTDRSNPKVSAERICSSLISPGKSLNSISPAGCGSWREPRQSSISIQGGRSCNVDPGRRTLKRLRRDGGAVASGSSMVRGSTLVRGRVVVAGTAVTSLTLNRSRSRGRAAGGGCGGAVTGGGANSNAKSS